MIKWIFITLVTLFGAVSLEAKRTVRPKKAAVDKVLAIIYHTDYNGSSPTDWSAGSTIICQSDLRPDLSDKIPTPKEVILKELVIIDAKKLKIGVSDTEIDRYLARAQEQLKMTREELNEFFKQRGYTIEQAKKELEKGLIVENTLDHRVKSKAHVAKSEIEKYHNDNPVRFYELKHAFVPFRGGSRAISRAVVDRDIESGAILTNVSWEDAGLVKEADFAPEKAFIKELDAGAVVKVGESDEGISLLQLVSKKTISLDERLKDITGILGKNRFMNALNDYYAKLLKDANIRYIDEDFAAAVQGTAAPAA